MKTKIDPKKKKIIIITAVVAIVLIIIFCLTWTKGFRTIKLLEVFNKVSFDRGDDKDVAVYDNMSIKAGDTLRTGDEESFARLVLDDDKYIYIEENSEVAFEMAGRKSNSKTTINLNYGAIFNELERPLTDKQSFEVKSPNSLMAVRGTKFRVSTYVGPDGILYTRVSVLEGKVQCWLIYPDGTISDESHVAEVGNEILIYYDDESGITDFARINEAGRYNSKEQGEYVRSISYSQMPRQALMFMSQRAGEEGGSFDAISSKDLLDYANLDEKLRDEPILERYGIPERELVDDGLLDHVRGDELADVAIINPNWNLATGAEYTEDELDGNVSDNASDNINSEDINDSDALNGDDSENANASENESDTASNTDNKKKQEDLLNNNVKNKKQPTQAELIEQYYKEILAHPDLYADLLPTPTPAPIVDVASSDDDSSSDETPSYVPDPDPSGDGGSSGSSGGGTPSGGGSQGGGSQSGSGNTVTDSSGNTFSVQSPSGTTGITDAAGYITGYADYNYTDNSGPTRVNKRIVYSLVGDVLEAKEYEVLQDGSIDPATETKKKYKYNAANADLWEEVIE